MDGHRFDDFIRRFGAERSRRSVFARLAQGGFAAALAAVGINQGAVVEEADAAQLEADANQRKCRRRCQNRFRRRRKRGVRLNKLRSQRRRCFRRCRPKPQPASCTVDVQCAYGSVCENGVCTAIACTPAGGQCEGLRTCVNDVCVPIACDDTNLCPTGAACTNGYCLPVGTCMDDEECGPGELCGDDNICEPDPEATCESDAECGVLSRCDTTTSRCVARVACTDDDDCDADICALDLGLCVDTGTALCADGEACPDGELCVLGICLGVTCLTAGLSCDSNADCCTGLQCRSVLGGSICLI